MGASFTVNSLLSCSYCRYFYYYFFATKVWGYGFPPPPPPPHAIESDDACPACHRLLVLRPWISCGYKSRRMISCIHTGKWYIYTLISLKCPYSFSGKNTSMTYRLPVMLLNASDTTLDLRFLSMLLVLTCKTRMPSICFNATQHIVVCVEKNDCMLT